jgi:hypothetical protein
MTTTLEQLAFVPPAEPTPPDLRIERMAKAGYAAYFHGRRGHSWIRASNAVVIRWECCARHVLDNPEATAESLHRAYWEGIDSALAQWQGAKSAHGRVWFAVLSAMRIAATAEAAA